MKLKPTTWTVIVIGLCSIGAILYDLFALSEWGREATISVVLNEWFYFANPSLIFALGMVFGGLMTHFLKWKP